MEGSPSVSIKSRKENGGTVMVHGTKKQRLEDGERHATDRGESSFWA